MPSVTNLATTAALTAVKNKIPNVSSLVKNVSDYDAKISEMKNKYFTIFDYHKCTSNILETKITLVKH